MLLRALGEHDAIPLADLGLRQAAAGAGTKPLTVLELTRVAELWKPVRGYAAILLWTNLLLD